MDSVSRLFGSDKYYGYLCTPFQGSEAEIFDVLITFF